MSTALASQMKVFKYIRKFHWGTTNNSSDCAMVLVYPAAHTWRLRCKCCPLTHVHLIRIGKALAEYLKLKVRYQKCLRFCNRFVFNRNLTLTLFLAIRCPVKIKTYPFSLLFYLLLHFTTLPPTQSRLSSWFACVLYVGVGQLCERRAL